MKKKFWGWLPIFAIMAATCFTIASCSDNEDVTNTPDEEKQDDLQDENEESDKEEALLQMGNPLTLEAIEDGAILFKNAAAGIVTYIIDEGDTHTIAAGANAMISVLAGQKVTFFGDNASYYDFVNNVSSNITSTADFYAYGNTMSLISSTDYSSETALTGKNTFYGLFKGATHLKKHPTKALVLPATILSDGCYSQMFSGCTALNKAPILESTALADDCYNSMFSGCTSLLKSPELPSKILADGCYAGMFYGCTGLKDAPNLPASTLAEKCYADMFSGCTGLTKAPLLPAKTLEKNCYNAMFMNCTMLADAPTLPATGLAQGCYSNMFNGCTGLTKTPNLSSRKLAKDCYNAMFMNCTNLTTVTLLPAFVVEDGCYNSMFMNCSNLINAPMLPATTLKNNCYANMFRGCSKLSSINCMAKDISATDCTKMWLDGVASAGKFVASAGTSWPSGTSGIPSGWTRDGEPLSCSDGVHPHMIDLGLPSGTKWACCNVGASKPEDYGSYYAWGEVVEKSTYTWASYSHGSSEDVVDFIGADIVGTIYDAAKHNWEASWQMPSERQVTELLTNTSWEWTTVSGINGVKLTSQNGKYIFIPTAGMHSGDMKYEVSSLGYYWTSTQYEGGQSLAYTLYIGNDYMHRGVDYRYLGHSVRPVSK